MDRTECLLNALGYQGGTVHQACEEIGVSVDEFLSAPPNQKTLQHLTSDYNFGWFGIRTCSKEHFRNVLMPRFFGNLDFWIGVCDGQKLKSI